MNKTERKVKVILPKKRSESSGNWISLVQQAGITPKLMGLKNIVVTPPADTAKSEIPTKSPKKLTPVKPAQTARPECAMSTIPSNRFLGFPYYDKHGNILNSNQGQYNPIVTPVIALDCEMVGVGPAGLESQLARVSLVNEFGVCIFDSYVKQKIEVTDYRTQVSGITPEQLMNAPDIDGVLKRVWQLVQGRILVGHDIKHDLRVLFLNHPGRYIRDTQRRYAVVAKRSKPSLKYVTELCLGVIIQENEHNSIVDAQAAMMLYLRDRFCWENDLNRGRNPYTKWRGSQRPVLQSAATGRGPGM